MYLHLKAVTIVINDNKHYSQILTFLGMSNIFTLTIIYQQPHVAFISPPSLIKDKRDFLNRKMKESQFETVNNRINFTRMEIYEEIGIRFLLYKQS